VLGLVDVSVPADGSDTMTGDAMMVDASPVPAPVVYFTFNGNHRDKVSGQLAQCMPNCPGDATGIHAGAVAFDGATDCLQFPASGAFPALSKFTVAFWFFDNSDTSYSLVSVPWGEVTTNADSWQIDTDTSETLRFTTDLNGITGTALHSAGFTLMQWHHVAATVDQTTLTLYIDGVGVTRFTGNTSGISYDTVPILYIGCDRDTNQYSKFFSGALDDLYVFDSVLTDAQIEYLATP